MDKLTPVGDRVILRYDADEETTPGGLIAPSQKGPNDPRWATVEDWSPDIDAASWACATGRVLVRGLRGVKVPGADLYVVDLDDILGFGR